MSKQITIHAHPDLINNASLPDGWTVGAYLSQPGWEGYYLLHDDCTADVVARLRLDYDADDDARDALADDLDNTFRR